MNFVEDISDNSDVGSENSLKIPARRLPVFCESNVDVGGVTIEGATRGTRCHLWNPIYRIASFFLEEEEIEN